MKPDEEQKILVALMKYGRVKLGKFGIFELRQIPARIGWNPITKEKKENKAHAKVAFKPLKKLKLYVNKMDTTE